MMACVATVLETAAMNTEQEMRHIGEVRTLGTCGPKYEVLRPLHPLDGGDWLFEVAILESGERLDYRRSLMLTDPLLLPARVAG